VQVPLANSSHLVKCTAAGTPKAVKNAPVRLSPADFNPARCLFAIPSLSGPCAKTDSSRIVNGTGYLRERKLRHNFRRLCDLARRQLRTALADSCGQICASHTVVSCLRKLTLAKSETSSRSPTARQARPGGSWRPTPTTPTSAAFSCPCSVLGRRNSTRKWVPAEAGARRPEGTGIRTSWWSPIDCPSIWSACPTARPTGNAVLAALSRP
jgi:hypothetical protein